jgi:hypothetical protein
MESFGFHTFTTEDQTAALEAAGRGCKAMADFYRGARAGRKKRHVEGEKSQEAGLNLLRACRCFFLCVIGETVVPSAVEKRCV